MIAPAGMNNEQLGRLIKKVAKVIIEDQSGFWKFELADTLVFVMTDESHNRMRIMTPISDLDTLTTEEMQTILGANYDRALDARYCTNDNVVWSAFLHPLRELREHQFMDALSQVISLSKNFGTTYSSSDLVFGG